MKLRATGFFLSSLAAHLAILGSLSMAFPYEEQGARVAESKLAEGQTWIVDILSETAAQSRSPAPLAATPEAAATLASKSESVPDQFAPPVNDTIVEPAPTQAQVRDRQAQNSVPEATASMANDQAYFPAGRLTRLPAPTAPVDLNVSSVNELPYRGKIALQLLIDARGMVADVVFDAESEDQQVFAERIAARFRRVRFTPGEIDGVPVKAQLAITVVSDSLTTSGEP